MYINFKALDKSGLSSLHVFCLVAIKQKDFDFTEGVNENYLADLLNQELISHIKVSKKLEGTTQSLRITPKGKKLLVDLSFEGAVDEESERIKEWVIRVYKKKAGGIVKNKTELGRRIQWFKIKTDIKGNFLALLIQCAVSDTYNPECGQSFYDYKKENPRAILSNMAENLFWSPASIFDKHKTLDKSPLYTYYEDNEKYIQQVWATNLDELGNRR